MSIIDTHNRMYRYLGIEWALHLLRPGATYEIYNNVFTKWDDPRPCPSWEEIEDTLDKIKKFEDSIDTIYLPSQIQAVENQLKEAHEAL